MKKIIVLAACLFMIPVASFAATKTAAKDPAVTACTGKMAGDAVTMTKKGKKVEATCQDVKGVMKAVPAMK